MSYRQEIDQIKIVKAKEQETFEPRVFVKVIDPDGNVVEKEYAVGMVIGLETERMEKAAAGDFEFEMVMGGTATQKIMHEMKKATLTAFKKNAELFPPELDMMDGLERLAREMADDLLNDPMVPGFIKADIRRRLEDLDDEHDPLDCEHCPKREACDLPMNTYKEKAPESAELNSTNSTTEEAK